MTSGALERMGGNRQVLALSIARMADALGNSVLFIVIPLYVVELPSPDWPLPQSVLVGLLISLYGLVNTALQPLMGALSDRAGRRKPFIQGGLFMMGAGTLAFSFAGQFSDLLLIRSLQGIGVALTIAASMGMMATVTEKKTRGSSMGIYTTFRMAGFALGPLIGGFLQTRFGFHAAFYAGAGVLALSMLIVQLWVRDVSVRGQGGSEGRPFRFFDRELWNPGLLGLGFAIFVMANGFTMMTTLENEFNARLGQTAFGFSIAFSALLVTRLLLQVPLGRLSDRMGRKPLILTGLVMLGPATALLGAAASTFQLTAFRVLQGLASAGISAPAFALAADLTQVGGEGRQMTILPMGFGLGLALGPLTAGALAVVFFELPFLVGGALALLGAWVVYRVVPETVHRRLGKAPTVSRHRPPAD